MVNIRIISNTKAFVQYSIAGLALSSSLALATSLYVARIVVDIAKERFTDSVGSKEDLLKELREEIKDEQ